MHGRNGCRLLVVLSLYFVNTVSLGGQSVRVPDFARSRAQDPAQDFPSARSSLRVPIAVDSERVPWGWEPRRYPIGPVPFPPDASSFSQIVRAAGMIFSGKVSSIAGADPAGAVRTVAITFHVEHAVRGASAGEDLTIVQWIGLWASGQRYRVGEHVFLLLYPPSKLGLSSCVAGPMGRFTVDALGRVIISGDHAAAFRSDPILGGKAWARVADFAQAVRHAEHEDTE
jgi:hypothetical protein